MLNGGISELGYLFVYDDYTLYLCSTYSTYLLYILCYQYCLCKICSSMIIPSRVGSSIAYQSI